MSTNAFITALSSLASAGAATEVIGLRADFYSEALRHPLRVAALGTNQVLVGPMSERELRDAIVRPAAAVHTTVEPGLVEILLHDLASAPGGVPEAGSLPLLSHALLTTWQRRGGRKMTVASYRETGGVGHAIAVTAETVYSQLTEAHTRSRDRCSFASSVSLTAHPTPANG